MSQDSSVGAKLTPTVCQVDPEVPDICLLGTVTRPTGDQRTLVTVPGEIQMRPNRSSTRLPCVTNYEFEPFPGSWAVKAGMTWDQLDARCKRVLPDVWIDKRAEVDFQLRSLAAGHWMKGEGVLSGFSASALHGAKWIDEGLPAEITTRQRWRKYDGLLVYRQVLRPEEIAEVAGFRVTTPARTAYDLAQRLSFDPAVAAVDALANATRITEEDVLKVLENHPRHANREHIRKVAAAMDAGAESPPETETRLVLVEHGLPRPETQIIVRDRLHNFIGRADMGYRSYKLLIEYEGAGHDEEEQYASDAERYHQFRELGWEVIQVTKYTLRQPWLLADRVDRALRARGWTG